MRVISALIAAACFCSPVASAFESDVHFGLTKFLALKAGYAEEHADTIALGNQRTDSGVMDTIQLILEYACLGKHADASKIAQAAHFPSAGKVPSTPEQRPIVAGSAVARQEVDKVLKAAPGKADFLLLKLGAGLHVLQDSWAYQGVSDTPDFAGTPIQCEKTLAWTAPVARGGWASHKTDLVGNWPEDVIAMATATYQLLNQYPAVAGKRRTATDWAQVRPLLDGFINAKTKAEKKTWFAANGIQKTSFLDGISLPNGGEYKEEWWNGRRLPPLKSDQTPQYNIPEDLKQFYNGMFSKWLGSDQPEAAIGETVASDSQRDLAARFKLWRLRDHGSAAELAHTQASFTKKELDAVDQLAKRPAAYAKYNKLSDAFFPLLEQGPVVSPLMPFVIHILPASETGAQRAVAVAKLRHAPYDEVAVLAEKVKDKWQAVRLISAVSH